MSGGWKFRFAGSGLSLFTEEGVVSEMIVLLRTRWRADFFRKLHPRLSLEPLLWNEIYITSSNWCYIKTDFLFFPTFDCNSWWWMAYRNLIDIQAIRFDEMDISSKKYTYIHTFTHTHAMPDRHYQLQIATMIHIISLNHSWILSSISIDLTCIHHTSNLINQKRNANPAYNVW
jgi:hypothetical protein